MMFSITASAWRAGSPSGQPATARICCSNWRAGAGLDGPVAGIVDAGRDLIDQQRAVLASQTVPPPARRHNPAHRRSSCAMALASSPCARVRRAGHGGAAQDMVLVVILRRIVGRESCHRRPAPRPPSLEGKIDKAFQDRRRALEALERLRRLVRAGDFRLALAVIAEAAGLQDCRGRRAWRTRRAPRPPTTTSKNGAVFRPSDCDKALFVEAVLGHRQRLGAGTHRLHASPDGRWLPPARFSNSNVTTSQIGKGRQLPRSS